MIERIDRPVACVRGFFFFLLGISPTDKRMDLNSVDTRGERRRSDVPDRPSVLCSKCLYSLKEYMVTVHVKSVEFWTSREEEVLSRLRLIFFFSFPFLFFFFFLFFFVFARMESFISVLCCQWCCVWMLNILKISQMWAAEEFIKKEKRRHSSASRDDLGPFYWEMMV